MEESKATEKKMKPKLATYTPTLQKEIGRIQAAIQKKRKHSDTANSIMVKLFYLRLFFEAYHFDCMLPALDQQPQCILHFERGQHANIQLVFRLHNYAALLKQKSNQHSKFSMQKFKHWPMRKCYS